MSLFSFFGFLFSSYFCFSSFLFLLYCLHISFSSNLQTRSLFPIRFLFPFSNYVSFFCKNLNVRQLLFFFYSAIFSFYSTALSCVKKSFSFFLKSSYVWPVAFPTFYSIWETKTRVCVWFWFEWTRELAFEKRCFAFFCPLHMFDDWFSPFLLNLCNQNHNMHTILVLMYYLYKYIIPFLCF